jgi:hypothetical protein
MGWLMWPRAGHQVAARYFSPRRASGALFFCPGVFGCSVWVFILPRGEILAAAPWCRQVLGSVAFYWPVDPKQIFRLD